MLCFVESRFRVLNIFLHLLQVLSATIHLPLQPPVHTHWQPAAAPIDHHGGGGGASIVKIFIKNFLSNKNEVIPNI